MQRRLSRWLRRIGDSSAWQIVVNQSIHPENPNYQLSTSLIHQETPRSRVNKSYINPFVHYLPGIQWFIHKTPAVFTMSIYPWYDQRPGCSICYLPFIVIYPLYQSSTSLIHPQYPISRKRFLHKMLPNQRFPDSTSNFLAAPRSSLGNLAPGIPRWRTWEIRGTD